MYINKRTLKDEKKYKNKIKFIYDRHRAQVLSDGMEKRKQILIYIKWYKCTLCNLAFDYLISLEPAQSWEGEPGEDSRGSQLRLRVIPTQNSERSSRFSQRKDPTITQCAQFSSYTLLPPHACVLSCVYAPVTS